MQQFKALMTKRLLNLRRDYKAVFTQLLGPVLFVLVALSIQGVRLHVALCMPRDAAGRGYPPATLASFFAPRCTSAFNPST